jgi:hypothetical protein
MPVFFATFNTSSSRTLRLRVAVDDVGLVYVDGKYLGKTVHPAANVQLSFDVQSGEHTLVVRCFNVVGDQWMIATLYDDTTTPGTVILRSDSSWRFTLGPKPGT